MAGDLSALPGIPRSHVQPWWVADLRVLAGAVSAGAVVGFLVIGLGLRLSMFLIAVVNPQLAGQRTDDGFVIGTFDYGATAFLLALSVVVGVVGALLYLALRPLAVGPHGFRVLSLVVGPAVVVSAVLVDTGGNDFTAPRQSWLPITLFVLLPLLTSWALVGLTEEMIRPTSWFREGSPWRAAVAAPAIAILPLAALLLLAAWLRVLVRRSPRAEAVLTGPGFLRAARVLAGLVIVTATVDLARDALILL